MRDQSDVPSDARSQRLLSHRLRGFAEMESTLDGLTAALAAGVRHVEFDVRGTKDGALIAYHDPFFRADDGSFQHVDNWNLDDLLAQRRMRHVPTLSAMVHAFAASRSDQPRLHIDVKVAGKEAALLAILESEGVVGRTVLVSWMASVLASFHALAAAIPLCFSHVTFARAPRLYRLAKHFGEADPHRNLARIFRPLSPYTSAMLDTAQLHFHDAGDVDSGPKQEEHASCNHVHVIPDLLSGRLLQVLQATHGFVGLPRRCANRGLVERYHRLGVRVALFSVKDAAMLNRLLSETEADIIYVDAARLLVGS